MFGGSFHQYAKSGRRLCLAVGALLLLAVPALVAPGAGAAPERSPSWVRTLPHRFAVNESLVGVVTNAAGGSYCTGRAYRAVPGGSDVVVARYDARGRRLWLRYWADSNPDSSDSGQAIALDAQGNTFVVADYDRAATGRNVVLLKYTPNGRLAWVRRFASAGLVDDYPNAVAVSPSGAVFVTGSSTVAGVSCEIFTLKYSTAGSRLWVSRHDVGSTQGYLVSLVLDGAGGLYGTGAVAVPGAGLDGFTARYSVRTGHMTWARTFGGSAAGDDRLREVVVHDSFVYAAGSADSGATGTDGLVVRYARGSGAQSGELVWDDGAGGANSFGGIATDDHGRYYVASGGTVLMAGSPALFTIRLSNSLGTVWTKTLLTTAEVIASDVDDAGSGRAAVSALLTSPAGFQTLVAEYRATGARRWSSILAGTPHLLATEMAASPDGAVSVGGMNGGLFDCKSTIAHYAP